MITVTPQEFQKAYEQAHKVYLEKSVNNIVKRADEKIKDIFDLNKKKNGSCQNSVSVNAKGEETLEMLQLAADNIRTHGYHVEIEDFGQEDMVLVISVKSTEV